MVKLSGGSRRLKSGSREYNRREIAFQQLMNTGRYSYGYFSQKGGGYVLVEKSTARHKPEEIEAARLMADKGYKVTLKDEAGTMKTPDGKIFDATFEQRTPDGTQNLADNIMNALRHGRDKKSDMVVIYQKNGRHLRQAVEQGIKMYESKATHRFKEIVVITRDGRIHRHKHNE